MRFGDSCYAEGSNPGSLQDNYDACSAMPGGIMSLWWPDNAEDLAFVSEAFPGQAERHVGYREIGNGTIRHGDNSMGLGIPFATHADDGTQILTFVDSSNTLNCVVLNTATKALEDRLGNCPLSVKPICKSRLGNIKLSSLHNARIRFVL